jgi:hypothetical protein
MHFFAAPASLAVPHSLSVRQSWNCPMPQLWLQLEEFVPHARA